MKEIKFEGYVLKYDKEWHSNGCRKWKYEKDVFKNQDGQVVPLVWNYRHDDPESVIGFATIKNRDDGVYAHCILRPHDERIIDAVVSLIKEKEVMLAPYVYYAKMEENIVTKGYIAEVSLIIDRVDKDNDYYPVIT